MLKRIAFFDGAGRITSMDRSVMYAVRILTPAGEVKESFGLTEALKEMVSEGKNVLDGAIVVIPGDEKEFDGMLVVKPHKARRGGRMAKPMKSLKNCEPGREFVFKMPDGRIVGKARNASELSLIIRSAPLASIIYHANGEHFTPWLGMMGMGSVGQYVKNVKGSNEDVRKKLLDALV